MVVETQEQLNVDHHPSAFHRVSSASAAAQPLPPPTVEATGIAGGGAGTMPAGQIHQHHQNGTATAAQQHQYLLAMLQQLSTTSTELSRRWLILSVRPLYGRITATSAIIWDERRENGTELCKRRAHNLKIHLNTFISLLLLLLVRVVVVQMDTTTPTAAAAAAAVRLECKQTAHILSVPFHPVHSVVRPSPF
uniref:Uncharacterized protein n=1 Tax=Globodera pallida TaxID=36090 RepID=A0A183CFR5_GLOPA